MRNNSLNWNVFQALVAVLSLCLLFGVMEFLPEQSIEITPGHRAFVQNFGLSVGVLTAGMIFLLTILLGARIGKHDRFSALAFSFFIGLITTVAATKSTDKLAQMMDFRKPSSRYEREFPVSRAYISHYRQETLYHIQLEHFGTDLWMLHDDYVATFGNREEYSADGYCLKAPVEQSGQAIRILYPREPAIPAGRVRRCSTAASAE